MSTWARTRSRSSAVRQSKGEWSKSRIMTVQFQDIAGTSVDDFRDGKGETVVWPKEYQAGDPVLPYSSIKH